MQKSLDTIGFTAGRGETGTIRVAGRGAVHVTAKQGPEKLLVQIEIAPGWHINSAKPLDDLLIPTRLSLIDTADAAINYPETVRRKLGVSDRKLAPYEGHVEIPAPLSAGPKVSSRAVLDFQPCSDRICLDQEKIDLLIPPIRDSK